MFLDDSRYAGLPVDEVRLPDGRHVSAVRLRPLGVADGEPHTVLERERLDLIAHERYGDGTRFWRIADANSALEARDLADEPGEIVKVPRTS